jgi:hypothetical protein
MAQVHNRISADGSICSKDRQQCLWALRMLASLHQVAKGEATIDVLARIPVTAPRLRDCLARAHASRRGYALGTWRNMRSSIFKALCLSGVEIRFNRPRHPLPRDWQLLFASLDSHQEAILYPFMRWCAERGWDPPSLTSEMFASYEVYLARTDLRAQSPRRTYRTLCTVWNKARADSKWPGAQAPTTTTRDWYIKRWEEFAPSFRSDVQAMLDAELAPDIFALEPQVRMRRVRETTARHHAYLLRRLASALAIGSSRDPKSICSIADLVQPAAAQAALRFLLRRSKQPQL